MGFDYDKWQIDFDAARYERQPTQKLHAALVAIGSVGSVFLFKELGAPYWLTMTGFFTAVLGGGYIGFRWINSALPLPKIEDYTQ